MSLNSTTFGTTTRRLDEPALYAAKAAAAVMDAVTA